MFPILQILVTKQAQKIEKNTKTDAKEKRVFLFLNNKIFTVRYVLRPNEITILYKKTINLTTVLRPQFLSSTDSNSNDTAFVVVTSNGKCRYPNFFWEFFGECECYS